MKKIHDITDLLKNCVVYDPILSPLLLNGAILDEYITVGRYPGNLAFERIGADEAVVALQAAREIRDAVIAWMSVAGSEPTPSPLG